MENLDLAVLRGLHDWRAAGRRALLATVVRTWGSAPRPAGAIMALREDGLVLGSVSGGCIEDDLAQRYAQACAAPPPPPAFVTYGVTADRAHRFGLPCGGTLELLLEHDPDAASLAALVQALDAGRLVRRTVRLADGGVTIAPADDAPDGLQVDGAQLACTFGPARRMLLIGAGQIGECLATMARFTGFAVTVCDPREEYRGAWAVPGVALLSGMPDDVVRAFRPDPRSCVVALTHDPKLDDLALLEALDSPAFYVGAISSRRNDAARRQRMAEHFGLDAASLARLRGPIGIPIGSRAPAEIAVSVMAEILAVKNGVPLSRDMRVAHTENTRGGTEEAAA
ncbi:XdhC family protein [Pseudorhodoferax sp.]|uniref:XdhC family protein n=1 Tax=Pseudorhodoferax sp. TaxID=1993553 RepID=UPI0039E2AADD